MARMMKDTNDEQDVVKALKVFNKDGNGFITATEIRSVTTNLSENSLMIKSD